MLPLGLAAQSSPTLLLTVTADDTGRPLAGAVVRLEGTSVAAVSDSTGTARLVGGTPGPQTALIEMLGYARMRLPVTLPSSGTVTRSVRLTVRALELEGVTVVADPVGRAVGELGTASVIELDAIETQPATSLRGLLELTPGVALQPPGLDGVEQFSLRTVPTSSVVDIVAGEPSAADIGSFGTLIVVDGVPLSNNANLQTLGARGELFLPSSARGGVDLRRIPAATIERVEVIRGVPSARYGDLTQGAIVVETRTGAFQPRAEGFLDRFTNESSFVGGWNAWGGAVTTTFDVGRTEPSPSITPDNSIRLAGKLGHRWAQDPLGGLGWSLDTRLDVYRLRQESPEDTVNAPGLIRNNFEGGLRFAQRLRYAPDERTELRGTVSFDHAGQQSLIQAPRVASATPFTDRLTEGRSTGRYIGGQYRTRIDIDGAARQLFTRFEASRAGVQAGGLNHDLLAGLVLRREWNGGAGYQFAIDFPPQIAFNGVQGFDRPRPFDEVAASATTAVYLDDRIHGTLGERWAYEVQAGLRTDVLHSGESWFSGARDVAVQPRFNAQLSPRPWLRLRGGIGRVAKQPTLGDLSPAPEYYDLVNVNQFTNDPAERLAVLTTFIRDPSNPDLGYSTALKKEVGIEVGAGAWAVTVSAFDDRLDGAVGIGPDPGFLVRDFYQLTDSVFGNGVRPDIIDPPFAGDSVPILVAVPSNVLTLNTRGIEITARFPQFRPLRLQFEAQAAIIESEFFNEGLDFGRDFRDFQVRTDQPRQPFWEAIRNTGAQALATYRLIHHQPELGLVVTGTVQHIIHEARENIGEADSLAYAGYIGRDGTLTRIAPERRADPEFADLRVVTRGSRIGTRSEVAPDWFLSLQVALEIPFEGRLALSAFNALARPGTAGDQAFQGRFFPAMRFGIEAAFRLPRLDTR